MIKQKVKIIILIVASFICLAMLALIVFMEQPIIKSDRETCVLYATLSRVDISSTTESCYVRIDTEAPQLTLYIPPYVTEYLDMNLLNTLVPESIITFRIDNKGKDYILSGKPGMIYSLSTNENSVFTLSEHNVYMNNYIRPMKFLGIVPFLLSLFVIICCLFSIRRKSTLSSDT